MTIGDLIEVELVVNAKNDYEYLIFEDMKAAGFEPVDVRSGASYGDGLSSNVELRDEKVAFFVDRLPQGRRVLRYRVRAEVPGNFHALPTNGYAMYAPEVRARLRRNARFDWGLNQGKRHLSQPAELSAKDVALDDLNTKKMTFQIPQRLVAALLVLSANLSPIQAQTPMRADLEAQIKTLDAQTLAQIQSATDAFQNALLQGDAQGALKWLASDFRLGEAQYRPRNANWMKTALARDARKSAFH